MVWLHGKTGVGKSRIAYEFCQQQFSDEEPYWTGESQWWNGYYGQRAVIVDDFDDSIWDYRFMLRLLDRYPMRVQPKGGMVQFVPRLIIVTSEYHPRRYYVGKGDIAQLLRRINVVIDVQYTTDIESYVKLALIELKNLYDNHASINF